jgi:leukotriene-A4 hydrolase
MRVDKRVCLALAGALSVACGGSTSPPRETISREPTNAAATNTAPVNTSPKTVVRDIHSYARPDQARVTHVALELTADFAAKTMSGRAALDFEVAPGATELVLDTQDLAVRSVTAADGRALPFKLGDADKVLGRALTIDLPPGTDRVVVDYATSPAAAALQWLAPSQTAGKTHPYLFSQGQAILTRTWIPTQDSPGIRQTYEARITAPQPLKVVMGAEQLTPDGVPASGGRRFDFRMREPIPPYLFAIAIGDLALRPLGARTGVFSEPAVVERAASEFVDLEKMVTTAEALYGPYRWGRYDLLVLPPSFPFGGMENPRLTFATPTILAGDRSLTSLVAHELAHSWSGNLVTNATWIDFWLNEGFTVFIERRIMEALYGEERAAMLELLGWRELEDEVKRLGPASPDTKLHLDLAGRNPDDGVAQVAYEKGAAFLRVIEEAVGRSRFDAYLRSWFDRHAFSSVTTSQFLADLRSNLLKGDRELERRIQIDRWVFEPGIPDNAVRPESKAFAAVEKDVGRFASGTPARDLDTRGWVTQQWQHFLQTLPPNLSRSQLEDLDRTFGFTKTGNSEVLFAWLRLTVRHRYDPALPALERFLLSQGRRKFLKPLYEDMMAAEWSKDMARRIYQRARPLYHAVATSTLDAIVK